MALYLYIQLRKVEAQWGDGLKGMRYQQARKANPNPNPNPKPNPNPNPNPNQARKALQELEKLDGQEHIKNWRPQVRLPCIYTCTCTCTCTCHMPYTRATHMPCTHDGRRCCCWSSLGYSHRRWRTPSYSACSSNSNPHLNPNPDPNPNPNPNLNPHQACSSNSNPHPNPDPDPNPHPNPHQACSSSSRARAASASSAASCLGALRSRQRCSTA
eukprot:scaffold21164_cov52-Phaeocystis_antarctica.AAC.3